MTPHGTIGGYTNHACRCNECKEANAEAHRKWMAKVAGLPVPDHAPHGTYATYVHYRCRCDECRAAQNAYKKVYRARKAAE